MAADVSVVNAAAYSTLGVTTTAIAEAVAADDTVATATSANLFTAEAGVPVNTAASSSAGKAIVEAAAADVKGVSVMCFFCMNSYLI